MKGGKKRKSKSKNFNSDTNKDKYGKGDVCDSEKKDHRCSRNTIREIICLK